ncbi:MAG: transport-associated protein [Desulfuromonas sp.]|nr:MAG: transport-associated protein [Desulfuromonas sp.]
MAIITISRQMGSGGIPIVQAVAEQLGYTLIDGESIREEAAKYGLSVEDLEQADEKPPVFIEEKDDKLAVDLHQIELIILEMALKGNVIIYGRGGQDLLAEATNVFRVRIIRPFEDRVENWAEREWLDPDYARILVRKNDQQRAGFIKYYFDRDWNEPDNYDLIINTERLSEEMAVDLICKGVHDNNLVEKKGETKRILKNLIVRKRIEIAVLGDQEIDAHHVEIEVKEGAVLLSGHIHSEKDRKKVVKIATAMDGVKKVTDMMKLVEYRNVLSEN